jgi:hypothetical protein
MPRRIAVLAAWMCGGWDAGSPALPPQPHWKGRSWMAKGKHATALFEVIHTAKRPPQGSPAAKMAAPRSWWKSKGKADQDESPPDQAARPSRLALMGTMLSPGRAQKLLPEQPWPEPISSPAEPVSPVIDTPPVFAPPRFVPPEPIVFEPPAYEFEPSLDDFEPRPRLATDEAVEKPVRFGSDGEIRFRLSYGGAIAAGMILLLLVAIAYLVGTRSAEVGAGSDGGAPQLPQHPDAAAAAASPQSAVGQAEAQNSGMLAAVTATPAASADPSTPPPPSATPAADTTHPLLAPAAGAQPAALAEPVRRQIGRHYVIVQSYPDADVANQARDFLVRRGIACTVIHGLPGWTLRNWYSVVGCRPFDSIHENAALDAYLNRLTDLGDYFAGHTTFNRFEPNLYRWRAAADAVESDR